MGVNEARPHILVLPEDDANRQLANGFALEIPHRQLQVLNVAGGWKAVLNGFLVDYATRMENNQNQHFVLLIDFDGHEDRLARAKAAIPEPLKGRVLIIGVWSEPERLKGRLNRTYEQIGRDLAEECRVTGGKLWSHELLRHNIAEIDRLRERILPILFPTA